MVECRSDRCFFPLKPNTPDSGLRRRQIDLSSRRHTHTTRPFPRSSRQRQQSLRNPDHFFSSRATPSTQHSEPTTLISAPKPSPPTLLTPLPTIDLTQTLSLPFLKPCPSACSSTQRILSLCSRSDLRAPYDSFKLFHPPRPPPILRNRMARATRAREGISPLLVYNRLPAISQSHIRTQTAGLDTQALSSTTRTST